MMYLANTIYIIVLILLIFFNVYIYYMLFQSKLGKYPPYVPTSRKRRKIILERISKLLEESKEQKVFLDAGSGTGDIIVPLAKKFPNHKFIGIEWSFIPYIVSKFKSRKLKNINLINDDMLKYSFQEVNMAYCYIVKNFEKPLSIKMVDEMKKDSIIITNGTLFENMELVDEIKFQEKWLSSSIYILKIK